MKFKFKSKTKKKAFRSLILILVGVLALGAVLGVGASLKKDDDMKVISPTFAVGGLNDEGKYVNTDASIYTKNAFECEGLEVKLDFDANVTYQAFYYDDLDNFISASEEYEVSDQLDVPVDATHARLVVTPDWDEDVAIEDRVCHWYDVYKYSSQLKISVTDSKEDDAVNLVEFLTWTESSGGDFVSERVNVRGYDLIEVVSKVTGGSVEVNFYDADGKSVGNNGAGFTVGRNEIMAIPAEAYKGSFTISCSADVLESCEIYLRNYK